MARQIGSRLSPRRRAIEEKQTNPDERRKAWRKITANRYVILIFRYALAGTFLLSSLGKLIDIGDYSVMLVMRFDILPLPLAFAFGYALPFIELSLALGLLFGVLTRLSAAGAVVLSISFLIAKAIVLSRGMDIDCGCFGPIISTMASATIYLDPVLTLMSLAVLLSPRSSRHWFSLGTQLSGRWSVRLDSIW